MRRVKFAVVIFIAAAMTMLPCEAEAQNAVRKLGRGLANVATGWAELPLEIARETSEKSEISGLFVAPFIGLFKAVGRTLTGVYETATFPIPLPSGYRPLLEPEFLMGQD